jgi:hypothetical protein
VTWLHLRAGAPDALNHRHQNRPPQGSSDAPRCCSRPRRTPDAILEVVVPATYPQEHQVTRFALPHGARKAAGSPAPSAARGLRCPPGCTGHTNRPSPPREDRFQLGPTLWPHRPLRQARERDLGPEPSREPEPGRSASSHRQLALAIRPWALHGFEPLEMRSWREGEENSTQRHKADAETQKGGRRLGREDWQSSLLRLFALLRLCAFASVPSLRSPSGSTNPPAITSCLPA